MSSLTNLLLRKPLITGKSHINNVWLLRCLITGQVYKSNKSNIESQDNIISEPIGFFGSKAAQWRAKDTHGGGADTYLWYQPYVISASLAVFLVYFCILREESDIDRKLEGKLFDNVNGLEEMTLIVSYKHNKQYGLDTKDIEQRLLELGVNVNDINQM